MTYDPSMDPTYEPEEQQETGFKLAPQGVQVIRIEDVDVDTDWESSKGNKGAKWTFTFSFYAFDTSGETTCKVWMDNTSQFGATCLYNLWMAIGLPYTIPDATKISKTTGQPRKSFFQALFQRQMDNSLKLLTDNLVGKYLLGPGIHQVKCPSCGWMQRVGFKVTAPRCKEKDMNACYFTEGVNVEPIDGATYASLDSTSFMPAPEEALQNLGVSNTPEATVAAQEPPTQQQSVATPPPPPAPAPAPAGTPPVTPPPVTPAPAAPTTPPVAGPTPPTPPAAPPTAETEDDLPF